MLVTVTPTIDTAIYADGDQVGTLMTIDGLGPGEHTLRAVTVVDKDKEKSALDLLFFRTQPTVASADNEAANVADAQLAEHFLAVVPVAAADYVDLSAASVATVRATQPVVADSAGKIYCLIVSGGTPTYTATSDLTLKFLFD